MTFKPLLPWGTTSGNLLFVQGTMCVQRLVIFNYISLHCTSAVCTWAGTSHSQWTCGNMTRSLQGVRLRHGGACFTLWLQLCSIQVWNEILSPLHFFPLFSITCLSIPEDRVVGTRAVYAKRLENKLKWCLLLLKLYLQTWREILNTI